MTRTNRNVRPAPAEGAPGFTLIELLVVIAIIALLVSILMPSLQQAKTLAGVAACQNQMHSLGIGVLQYTNECNDFMPYVDGSGNADTYLTVFGGKSNGYGRLYQMRLVENPRMFYCPGAKAAPGYGANDEQNHRDNRDNFAALFTEATTKGWTTLRCDYVLGWWTEWSSDGPDWGSYHAWPPRWRKRSYMPAAPEPQTLTSYTSSKRGITGTADHNYQALGVDSRDWLWPSFGYAATSHNNQKFQNVLKTDGSVKVNPDPARYATIMETKVQDNDAAGYELDANNRPPYGWWWWYGPGLRIGS